MQCLPGLFIVKELMCSLVSLNDILQNKTKWVWQYLHVTKSCRALTHLCIVSKKKSNSKQQTNDIACKHQFFVKPIQFHGILQHLPVLLWQELSVSEGLLLDIEQMLPSDRLWDMVSLGPDCFLLVRAGYAMDIVCLRRHCVYMTWRNL